MSQWNGIHTRIKAIKKRIREEFRIEVTPDILETSIKNLLDYRLSEMLTHEFDNFTTEELLISEQIVRTDQRVMDLASDERKKSGKKKGQLN